MARILRVFGLTLGVVLALCAVFALSAGAAEWTSFNTNTEQHESVNFKGEDKEAATFAATATSTKVTCDTGTYSGSSATGTEATPTIKPSWASCHTVVLGATINAEVATNNCDLTLHVDNKVNEDEYTGHASIMCEVGAAIEVKVPSTGCVDRIPGGKFNQNLNNVTYTNNTGEKPTDVVVHIGSTNVYNEINNSLACGGIAAGVHETGTIALTSTAKAFNTKGEQIDLTVMGA
jgi:hypothetical protein